MLTHGTGALMRDTAKAAFWQSFSTTPMVTESLIHRADSTSDQETYPFLSAAPSPIEMQGSRTHKSVPEISYTIKNKKWESTVDVSYELWRFNRLGQIAALSAELGQKARLYPDNLLSSTLLNSGHSTTGPDSQFFFDTDHKDPGAAYSTNQDNDLTISIVSATAPTDVEFAAAVRASMNALRGFKDGQGDPFYVAPDTVFECHVPIGYLAMAERVATVDQITGPVGNDVKGRFRPVYNPYIDATSTQAGFYMFNTSNMHKPFILQTADPVVMEDNLGSDMEKETKDRWIGSFGYYNVGYGDWRTACKYLFTTT